MLSGRAGILAESSFFAPICISFCIAGMLALESCGASAMAFCAGAVTLSGAFAGVGDGTTAGFGGVYCSIITGVAIPRVGSFLSFAIAPVSSIESGSSCCAMKASTPMDLTRSTSPGRAPKVKRDSTCAMR